MPRTSDSDIHDTRPILRPNLRHTYDSDGFTRVTRTSLSDVYHHLKLKAGILSFLKIIPVERKLKTGNVFAYAFAYMCMRVLASVCMHTCACVCWGLMPITIQ